MTKNKKQFFTLVILNKDDLVGFKYVYSLINKKDFFEVFVVDGDSKDGSVDYFIKKKIKYKILKKGGRGAAMRYALQNCKTKFIIFLSSDGEENPNDLKTMQNLLMKGNDLVIGSRVINIKSHNSFYNRSFIHRLIFLKIITFFVNLFFKGSLTDSWNGYRGFKTKKLKKIKSLANDHLIELEQSIKFLKKKFKITEFPTVEKNRVGGVSKIPIFMTGFLMIILIIKELIKK